MANRFLQVNKMYLTLRNDSKIRITVWDNEHVFILQNLDHRYDVTYRQLNIAVPLAKDPFIQKQYKKMLSMADANPKQAMCKRVATKYGAFQNMAVGQNRLQEVRQPHTKPSEKQTDSSYEQHIANHETDSARI
jgi:hypothetical protein